jgi:hypothetical protein
MYSSFEPFSPTIEKKAPFFMFKDKDEGNVSIGELPDTLHTDIDYIEENFMKLYSSEIKNFIYHKWYTDLDTDLKNKIDHIKDDPFWNNLCSGENCSLIRIDEMDEIYYTKPPKDASKKLFGAVGNYYVHRDGHFRQEDVKLYRVLIGVSEGNKNIMTYLTNLNYGKSLNKYDYLAFDWDRTTHQVINNKQGKSPEYRIILKLHFMVSEKPSVPEWYLTFLKNYNIYYLKITRYVMEKGTNPKTLDEFFFGVLSYIIGVEYNILLSIFIFTIVTCLLLFNRSKGIHVSFEVFAQSLLACFTIFLGLVLYEWASYKLSSYNKERD